MFDANLGLVGARVTSNDSPMANLPMALTGVPTDELKALLRNVYRGEIEIPITTAGLALVGLQHRAEEIMQSLRNLDEPGVRAVLVAVAAERIAIEERGGR